MPNLPIMEWFHEHSVVTGWLLGLSVLLFVSSLVVIPLIVTRMRPDYFLSRKPAEESWPGRHPVMRGLVMAVKNLLGIILLLAGLAMLVLPGQGLIAILVGVSLLNFPGKRRLELAIARERHLFRAINWMRRRAGRPPLLLPDVE